MGKLRTLNAYKASPNRTAQIHLIAFFVTYSSKPRPTTQTNGSISPNGGTSLSAAAQHALASLPTNAVLHCISVSSYCFKHGRITVPPRVALVASGFGDATKGRWTRLQELRKAKKLVPLIRGGWREEEDGSGKFKDFWQLEEFEETRLGRVHWLGKLREGLENYGTGARAE